MALKLKRFLPSLFRLTGAFSLPVLHGLGGVFAPFVLFVSAKQRRRMKENLGLALGREPSFGELWRNAIETARMMLELPYVWLRPLEDVLSQVVEVQGWEKVEALREAGRPMVALTPHLGCFEIISLYIGARMPMTALYRPPKQGEVEPFLQAGRSRGQIQLATADFSGVRRLIKALRQGEATGLLPDQVPSKGDGLWLPFFGRPAYTMTLAARLSEVPGVGVLLFRGERVPFRGWRIHVEEPREAIEGPLAERTAIINREIERTILECPLQYIWAYNRYKIPAGVEPPASPS